MTTIACDGRTMAGDGLLTSGDTVVTKTCIKVFRLKDGRVIGFAGNAFNWQSVLDHYNEGHAWPQVTGESAIMLLDNEFRLYVIDADGRSFERPAPFAIGTGRSIAIGALDAGVSAERAVEIAAGRDTQSGGIITVVEPLGNQARLRSVA